jgi:hypothetical protein
MFPVFDTKTERLQEFDRKAHGLVVSRGSCRRHQADRIAGCEPPWLADFATGGTGGQGAQPGRSSERCSDARS